MNVDVFRFLEVWMIKPRCTLYGGHSPPYEHVQKFLSSLDATVKCLKMTLQFILFIFRYIKQEKLFDSILHCCTKENPHIHDQLTIQLQNHEKTVYATLEMSRLMTKPTKWPVRPAKTQFRLGMPSLTRVFAVRSKGSCGPNVSSCGQRRLWSDWADAQADLSLRWEHRSFCLFCHAVAQLSSVKH